MQVALALSLALHLTALGAFWLHEQRATMEPAPPPPLFVNFIAPTRQAPASARARPKAEKLPTRTVAARTTAATSPTAPMTAPRQAVAPTAASVSIAAPAAVATTRASAALESSANAGTPVALRDELSLVCPERPPPDYPALSRRRGETGSVVVLVELDAKGTVTSARIEHSSSFERLDQAALVAVRSWHCDPPLYNGKPTRSLARQPFSFVLR